MNKNSKFHSLSPEDRQQILRWCEEFTYEEAVEKCALPRPEGLDLQTSVSAIQRFYASYSPLCYDGDVLLQCARAARSKQLTHDPEVFREVILNVVEQRIFAALLARKPLREISSEFRILFGLHRLNSQWRKQRAQEVHDDHIRHLPTALAGDDEEDEFTPIPTEPTPGAEPPKPVAASKPATPSPQAVPPPPSTKSIPPNGAEPIINMADIFDQLTGQSTPASAFPGFRSAKSPGIPAFPANPGVPKGEDPKLNRKDVLRAAAHA